MIPVSGLLTIDPGLRNHLGWSYWWDRRLILAGVDTPTFQYRVDHVLMELPQVYPGLRAKDPNDLISIATDAGLRIGRFRPEASVQFVKPRGWKGTIAKDVFTRRIVKVAASIGPARGVDLRAALAAVPSELRHNAIDAVGLGLWKLYPGSLG